MSRNDSIERLGELINLTEYWVVEAEMNPSDIETHCLRMRLLRADLHLTMAEVHDTVAHSIRGHAAKMVRPLKAAAHRSGKRA
jgi:hypothetical protein